MPDVDMARLLHDGDLALDIEYGNVHGFFSARREASPFIPDDSGGSRTLTGRLTGALMRLHDSVQLTPSTLSRDLSVSALEQSETYDVVNRFVVTDRSACRSAWIAGRQIQHRQQSRYHQFPAGRMVVPVGLDHWLIIDSSVVGNLPEGMQHLTYLRDEPSPGVGNRWIVHQRLLAQPKRKKLYLRGCHPLYNDAFPSVVDSLVPGMVKRRLYRIRETTCPNSPVMAVSHSVWPAGTQLTLHADIKLSHGAAPY